MLKITTDIDTDTIDADSPLRLGTDEIAKTIVTSSGPEGMIVIN